MIVTTSGSNSGIGFAIPIDTVREKSDIIIEKDRLTSSPSKSRPSRGWLGIEVVVDSSLDEMLRKKLIARSHGGLTNVGLKQGVFVLNVKQGSAASRVGIKGLTFSSDQSGVIDIGDRIVGIGGRVIENRRDLEYDIKSRVEGEQLSITVENAEGNRRVLYVTLDRKALNVV